MRKITSITAALLLAAVSFTRAGAPERETAPSAENALSTETAPSAETAAQNNGEVKSYRDLIPGAFTSRPANAPGGKLLTMEEAVLSRDLSPRPAHYEWRREGKSYVPVEIAPSRDPRAAPPPRPCIIYT